jgi:hypothetical protein
VTNVDLFNQLYLNMFRASLRPPSGEKTALYCIRTYGFQHWLLLVVVLESRE